MGYRSSAIKGLGGKGIIDIVAATNKEDIKNTKKELQELDYEFRPTASTDSRLFFRIDLPDPDEKYRRYHLHLTTFDSIAWNEMIKFRDYLHTHPKIVKQYIQIKRKAVTLADQDGERYRKLKEPFIKDITAKATKS